MFMPCKHLVTTRLYTLTYYFFKYGKEEKNYGKYPRKVPENVIWIDFNVRFVDKLFIKSGNKVTVKFRKVSVSYLNGLILIYFPLTQKNLVIDLYQRKNYH